MSTLNKTYDVKTAAAMFGMSYLELYKLLRGECKKYAVSPSWVHVGSFKNDPAKNQPKEWARKAGYLTTDNRGRPAPYNTKVTLPYCVTTITEHGMKKLEHILGKNVLPKPLELTHANAVMLQQTHNATAANDEREKLLKEFNLPIYPAKAS